MPGFRILGVWLLAAAALGVLALAFVHHLDEDWERRRASTAESLELYAQAATAALNRNLLAVDLVLAAQNRALERDVMAGAPLNTAVLRERWRAALDQQVFVRELVMLDPQGQVLASGHEASQRLGVRLPAAFLATLATAPTPTLRVSEPVLNEATGETAVWLARVEPGGPRQRLLLAEVPVATLANLFAQGQVRSGIAVTVERDDGTLLASHPAAAIGNGPRRPLAPHKGQVDPSALEAESRVGQGPSLVVAVSSVYPAISLSVGMPLSALRTEFDHAHSDDRVVFVAALALVIGLAGLFHWHLLNEDRARQRVAASHAELVQQVQAREAADAERERTRRLMEGLLASTQEGFWQIDNEGRTVDLNPAMCALLGRPREAVLGRGIFDFVDEANAAVFRAQIALRRQGRGGAYEISLQRPDGSLVACINNATPIHDEHGQRVGSVGLWTDVSVMKAAQRELAQAKGTLDRALGAMAHGFLLFDAQDRIVLWNPQFAAMFPHLAGALWVGMPATEMFGLTADLLFGTAPSERRTAWMADQLRRQRGGAVPYEVAREGGRIVEVVKSVTDDGGVVAVYQDVTLRRAAEHELATAKATLDRALDAMNEGFVVYGPDDRVVLWNRRYLEIYAHLAGVMRPGVHLSEVQQAAARFVLPDGSEAERADFIARRARLHRANAEPFEVPLPDGRVIEVFERTTPDGGFVGLLRDVTTAHLAQRELAEAKATLEQTLDTMSDGFVVFGVDKRLLLWNRRYVEMFPYLRDAVRVGRHMDELAQVAAQALKPNATEDERRAFIADRNAQRELGAGMSRLALHTGLVVEVVDRRTPDGKHVSLMRDMTHVHRAERALAEARDAAEAAARSKSRFLAAMSHEIRTPLNAVLGMNGLLAETALTEDQRRHVELIGKSGESLLAIINDILDLSRLEAGRLTLELVDFALSGAVHDVVSMMSARAQAKGLQLSLHAPPGPVQVRGDPSRLRQVLFNLIGNAIKFTNHGSVEVRLAAEPREDNRVGVRIAVHDSGIGIEPEVLSTLFEPFIQADSSTSRRFGGTGLGLSICREIVTLMGGQIGVTSQPGVGSVFTVELVLDRGVAEPAALPPDKAPAGAAPPLRPLRILVAEDNVINQMLIRAVLTRMGHHADLVADGIEALQQVQSAPYDVVLMDVQMPEMDGLTATQAIRALPGPVSQVPIVAMTANVLSEDRAACLAAGMDSFVGKPIDRMRLQQALEAAAARASRGVGATPS